MKKTFKYRLYPSKKQEEALLQTLTLCRHLYNTALQHRREAYKKTGVSISYQQQQNELPLLKKDLPEYQTVQSQVLQDVLKRVDKAFKAFFRRIKSGDKPGFPRFRGKDRYHSFTYPQSGFRITSSGNRIALSKIGLVRIKMHRLLPENATIKTCTIKKEGTHRSGGRWYCTLSCELPKIESGPPRGKTIIKSAIGIDLGLESFATTSEGTCFDNPRHLKKSEQELKALQQKYTVHKGKATKRKLSALHRKVANQRKDFLHKLSTSLVKQYDAIFYEDLKIKEMIMDNQYHLEKSIHDAGWRMFTHMIVYKAEYAGKHAVKVNPKGTSQRCSKCDTVVKKELYQRKHECPQCGYIAHRDHNAAQNILKLGTSLCGLSALDDLPSKLPALAG